MKRETGKGGSFDTRPNPFAGKVQLVRNRPNLTEVSNIGRAIQVLLQAGCAMLIGQTRDGGALVLTILDGDTRHRTYCSNDSELQDAFDAIEEMYSA